LGGHVVIEPGTVPTRRHWFVGALISAGWAPLVVFALHVFAAKVLHLYRTHPDADIPMHLAGGAAIAFLYWSLAKRAAAAGAVGRINKWGTCLLVFGLVGTTAVFWEFAEFLSDRWFHTGAQSGLQDTLGDMFFGITGGAVFLIVVATRKPS
jgi:hypothetical protein